MRKVMERIPVHFVTLMHSTQKVVKALSSLTQTIGKIPHFAENFPHKTFKILFLERE